MSALRGNLKVALMEENVRECCLRWSWYISRGPKIIPPCIISGLQVEGIGRKGSLLSMWIEVVNRI